jgi:transcriptional regulator with AAA-type ATPase domain
MPVTKLSEAVVRDILRLSSENDAAAIARKLDLNRMQVAAILAHQRLQESDTISGPSADSTVEPDFWQPAESPPPMPRYDEDRADAVVDAEEEELAGIYVGDELELETPIMWDPTNPEQVQNPHLMVMGESGSGKTYAAQCLVAAELAHAGIPSIIFDYGQSFESDKLERPFVKYCHPQEHLIGEEGLSLNPLQILRHDSPAALSS